MKKLKLIYNPMSGSKSFKDDIDLCISILQEGGYEVSLFRSAKVGDVEKHIAKMSDDIDVLVISGGDGTINRAVNILMERGLDIPVGIIPSGTANDFARFLNIKTRDVKTACEAIVRGKTVRADLGLANGQAFVNVCGGGLLTNVSQHIDIDFKNSFGRLAYYIKGAEQIANMKAMPLRITTKTEVIEDDFYLFLALNSSGAGSFDRLSPDASITDGLLDFFAIKKCPVIELPAVCLKILRGEHIGDPHILYFNESYVKIENLSDEERFDETDVDGEQGPDLPIEIRVWPKALTVFTNK
ncbi:MAG: YegS/Rv2252/BmrU family lipid kinase [Lachnospiraceae bacterium]|nr:YegS/Rv2252/BmrU family lipid kinase [Lachnospiraceae bacterium]